jgi:hypothetical protein
MNWAGRFTQSPVADRVERRHGVGIIGAGRQPGAENHHRTRRHTEDERFQGISGIVDRVPCFDNNSMLSSFLSATLARRWS